MNDKKQINFKSPDTSKLQEVIIDGKTIIYIPMGADADEARSRYLSRVGQKKA